MEPEAGKPVLESVKVGDSWKARNDVILTRIENASTPGIPDILLCDEKNNFHLIELKVSKGNVVKLSPHQVAFAVKHSEANVGAGQEIPGKTARITRYYCSRGPRSLIWHNLG